MADLKDHADNAMADAHEVNVAPHNFYGHLCSAMSANFCAALPNFRIMEIEIDDVAWKDDLVTHPPEIKNGEYVVSDRPGWGQMSMKKLFWHTHRSKHALQ